MPRRIGTDRQMPTRSVRRRATKSDAGCSRAACRDVSTLSSSRAGRRETLSAMNAPTTTATMAIAPSQTSSSAHASHSPLAPAITASSTRRVGLSSRTAVIRCVAIRTAMVPPTSTAASRTTFEPRRPRRTYSTTQAMVCASAVPVNSQRYTGSRASGSNGRGPTA